MVEKIEVWKRNESKEVADCRVFRVREDFSQTADGAKSATFFVIENPDWVNIIAFTKTGEVILIEQYRHGIERAILEIPGGMIDGGEEPLSAAKRELLEETGYSSGEWTALGESHPNPAIQNNTIYHFLAVNCEKTAAVAFDEHENVITKLYPAGAIEKLIADGKITHSLVLTAFYFLNLKNYES